MSKATKGFVFGVAVGVVAYHLYATMGTSHQQ